MKGVRGLRRDQRFNELDTAIHSGPKKRSIKEGTIIDGEVLAPLDLAQFGIRFGKRQFARDSASLRFGR